MPGICGIVDTRQKADPHRLLNKMTAALRNHSWHVVEKHVDRSAGVALGRVSLGFVNTGAQPERCDGDQLAAVMDGELFDAPRLCRDLRAAGYEVDEDSHARILLFGYRRGGPDFLRRLQGSFTAAIWDGSTSCLTLLNDRFGSRPLYFSQKPGCLLFSSSVKSLTAEAAVSGEFDPTGLAQFFTYGHYLGQTTSLSDIRLLPAATCATYRAESDDATTLRYWRIEEEIPKVAPGQDELLERIDSATHVAVQRSVQGEASLGLALSGGLDARTILGVIDHRQTSVKTLCLGMEGSLDHRCAHQLADLVGCPHHNYVLSTDFLHDFRQHLEDMVRLTDGQYLSQCIVMPTLPLYRQLGIEVLLRGHAGELMHMDKAYNFSLDREALACRSAADVEDWLWRHLQAYMLNGVEKPLFTPPYQRELRQLARQSLHDSFAETAGVGPPLQRVWRLFLNERIRRETALSLAKFRSVVETRLPYMDADLVTLLLAAPPHLKLGETIQTHILRKRRPGFLRVVNANTGARMGAGRLARRCATLKMRALAKLGAPGYQPYERLGLWLRRELAPLVRDILLSDQCLDRGVFDPEGVESVVTHHLNEHRNHTYLLLAMMIFELGQRYLLEEDGCGNCRTSPSRLSTVAEE